MEQYEKSGPGPDPEQKKQSQNNIELQRLEELCLENSALIKELQREIRRLKTKLDAHALMINQMRKNG
jgi:hypothetical protein